MIIDDEPLARRELRRLLLEFSWVDIVGEAGQIVEAAGKIEALRPELIFLDIQMPGGSGFDLLAKLDEVPQVIFTTAHSEHAVRAFEVNALDYLLKPVEPERLADALGRLKRGTAAEMPHEAAEPAAAPLEQLFVRDGPRCWLVPLREVRLLAAEGNYVRLLWGKLRPLLGRPLTVVEQRLDPKLFFRANRSQIVNLNFIESVDLGVNGSIHVLLREGGPEVEISRRQARRFKTLTSV